jgi:hypothetical protein
LMNVLPKLPLLMLGLSRQKRERRNQRKVAQRSEGRRIDPWHFPR